MPFDKRQKELNLFSPEKRRLRKDLTTPFQYAMVIKRSHMENTKGKGYKSHQEWFHLSTRYTFFHSENDHSLQQPLSRVVVEIPSLEV